MLQNPFHSYLFEFIKKINNQIKNNYNYYTDYKSYDKNENDLIVFKFFNINSIVKSPQGVIIEKINYNNSLEFTFNKLTNEILLYKVPSIQLNKELKLGVFTYNIADIITKALHNNFDIKNIKIVFSDKYCPLIIDEKVKDIIPSIINTENYCITYKIIESINKELEIIKKRINSYKAHQDKNIKTMQKIYEKRRIIYGIDPINYNTIDDFHNAVTAALKEKLGYIIRKIDRHIESTTKSYANLFFYQFTQDFNKEQKNKYTKNELLKKLKSEKLKNNVFSVMLAETNRNYLLVSDNEIILSDEYNELDYYHNENNIEQTYKVLNKSIINSSKNDYEILEKIINISWNFDLKNNKGLLHRANIIKNKQKNDKETWQRLNINFFKKYAGNEHILNLYTEENKRSFDWWAEQIEYKYNLPNYNGPLFQAINLVLQYEKLNIQKEYYLNVLNNIEDFTINLSRYQSASGGLYTLPYWIQEGHSGLNSRIGTHRKKNCKPIGALFLIKPGCKYIDINKIPYMHRDDNKVKNKYNLELFKNSHFYKFGKANEDYYKICNENDGIVLAITIPKSLPYIEIKKIIKHFKKEYQYSNINYICENIDVYVQVKSILVDHYLKEYERLKDTSVIKNTHICIDPNYYDEYFKTLPTAVEFFHKYDYTWNYKFRKKEVLCIEDLCDIYINRNLEDYKELDFNKIKTSILGSYDIADFNDELYMLDQCKYSALNYYFKIRYTGYGLKYTKRKDKTIIKDFYDVFGNNNIDLAHIFDPENMNEIDDDMDDYMDTEINDEVLKDLVLSGMILVAKDKNNYRALTKKEIDIDICKLARIGNICVALLTGQSVIIWKNFPYHPLDKEEISIDKVKTYIKKSRS